MLLPSTTHLLDEINRSHGTTFRLMERYERGEQGAFALEDAAGCGDVLRRLSYAGTLTVCGRPWRRSTCCARRGITSPATCSPARLPERRTWSRRRSRARRWVMSQPCSFQACSRSTLPSGGERCAHIPPSRGRSAWPAPVVDAVGEGGDGSCLLSSLRDPSCGTALLLERLQAIVARHPNDPCARDDVVHGDVQGGQHLGQGRPRERGGR